MPYWRLLVLVLAFIPAQVLAGPWEDSMAAYKNQDYLTVLRLVRPLAERGEARAQFVVGSFYQNGLGVSKDYQQAIYWYSSAAAQGEFYAQSMLGLMHEDGQGVPKDAQQAYFWYLLAATKGNAVVIEARDRLEAELTPQQRADAQTKARNWKPTKP